MPSVTQLSLFDNLDPKPKRCPQCKEWYPLTDEYWNKNKSKRDGYCTECKQCKQKKDKQYRIKNPQKTHQNMKEWRSLNPDYNKTYYQKNIIQAREYANQYRKDHLNQVKKTTRTWHKNNPIYRRISEHKRRAQKKGNGGSYTQEELQTQFEAQGRRCFHCGKFISLNNSKTCHIDHWIPISKGGLNNIDNVRLLCPSCNLSKHNKLPCEWHPKYCE